MSDTRSCPSARLIIAAWSGDARVRRFVEKHVESCAHCTAIVDALEKFDAAFGDESSDIYDEIVKFIDDRLALDRPHRWEWVARAEPEFHHRVVIAHLIERSDECYPSNPTDGLCYADAAIAAFEAMSKRKPPQIAADALLFATTLKNRATHLYLLGRYSQALCAADASASAVAPFGETEGVVAHRGAISLARCMIYGDIDVCEYERALSEVADAEAFFELASPQRVPDALWWRAMILARSGRVEEARRMFSELFAVIEPESPRLGSLLQCLAWCALLQYDDDSAFAYATDALAILFGGHDHVDVAKAEWVIGRVLSRRGDHLAARTSLDRAASTFSESNQLDIWVRVRLDYVYDLLVEDGSADVRALCESIAAVSVALDQREPLRRHHCTSEALAYLRRAAVDNALTPDNVAYVIKYLDRLTTAPPNRFTPPRADLVM